MTNVLYVGPYRHDTIAGQLSRDYLYSLYTCDINLYTRTIYNYGDPIYTNDNDEQFKQIADHPVFCDKFDSLIQMSPHFMSIYDGRFGKNYGIYQIDNTDIEWTNTKYRAKILDEIWVGSNIEQKTLLPTQSKVVGIPINTKMYNEDIPPYDFKMLNKTFKFYFMGDLATRNNLAALISAFLLEFKYGDKVSLIILTNNKQIDEDIASLKKLLRKHLDVSMYREIFTMVGNVPLNKMCSVHKGCDCFVAPVRNQAYNQEILYAGLFKNNVIVTDGLFDHFSKDNAWMVKSDNVPVFIKDNTVADTNTSHESWLEPNIQSLRHAMRESFENIKLRDEKSEILHDEISANNSYKQIGQNISCLIQ